MLALAGNSIFVVVVVVPFFGFWGEQNVLALSLFYITLSFALSLSLSHFIQNDDDEVGEDEDDI